MEQCPEGRHFRSRRILIQDSTILKLPAWHFAHFSGVANAHGTVCNARLQAVYDLVSMSFLSFSLDSYSRNDLSAAPALPLGASSDLTVLRDRGYLSAEEIERHVQAGAHCIYRYKTKTTYLDPETLQPIELCSSCCAKSNTSIKSFCSTTRSKLRCAW